jgi:hypothetical protein
MRPEIYIELSRGEVAHRARRLWQAAGRPPGRDLEYWLQAEVELLTTKWPLHPKHMDHIAEKTGQGHRN